jgi:succinate dehydrogenase / fumarate reductase membrane anchor subunit
MDVGMRTIIEDYVHGHMRKLALLFLNSAFTLSMCLLCVFAVLMMMFESAAG